MPFSEAAPSVSRTWLMRSSQLVMISLSVVTTGAFEVAASGAMFAFVGGATWVVIAVELVVAVVGGDSSGSTTAGAGGCEPRPPVNQPTAAPIASTTNTATTSFHTMDEEARMVHIQANTVPARIKAEARKISIENHRCVQWQTVSSPLKNSLAL